MAIRRLKVSNFRSFNELDVELGDFNVLIGANASGKSNFVDVFRFLRDIRKEGLRSAVALQGGWGYVQNLQLGTSRSLSIDLTDDQSIDYTVTWENEGETAVYIRVNEMNYGFSLDASPRDGMSHRNNWHIQRDRIARSFSAYRQDPDSYIAKAGELLGEGVFSTQWDNGRLVPEFDVDPQIKEPFLQNAAFISIDPAWFPPSALLMESRFFPHLLSGKPVPPFGTINQVGIYRIDANALRHGRHVRAPAALTEDATNLAPILDRILSEKHHRKKLLNLVRFLLPFIDDIGVQDLTDESLLLYVREAFTGRIKIYGGLMSEGTIAAIALVIVLYFEENPLVIFEDPDRGVHPKLMSRIVEMMKEVSQEKQIIVTTHHPEMVRYAGVENLLLVTRDENGFSQISRPADKTMVKRFLESDIGIDDLYVDNLLEV